MLEMHLRLPGFCYNACRTFTKNKERIEKFKATRDSRYIYQNELDKLAFKLIWIIDLFKFCPKQRLRIKYYMTNNLILIIISTWTCFIGL